MMISCASSEPPLPLERCRINQQAASCTAPLRSAPDVFLQHLSKDIANSRNAANVVLFSLLQRNRDFAPHAGASNTFQASEKATAYCENVVLAAAMSMPLFAMSFKLEPQACFQCYIFVFFRMHFFLIFVVCCRCRRSSSRDDSHRRRGGAIAATAPIETAVPFQTTTNYFEVLSK